MQFFLYYIIILISCFQSETFVQKQNLIINSPAGYKGFYTLGTTAYISDTYDDVLKKKNFLYSGASAGAWNSLVSVYEGSKYDFALSLVNYIDELKKPSLKKIQKCMQHHLLTKYDSSNFDFSKCFIGVSTINGFRTINCNIYSNFNSLDDALKCCMASSHIPLITGGLYVTYNKKISIDGAFSSYPYYDEHVTPLLQINHTMWNSPLFDNTNKQYSFGLIPVRSRYSASDLFFCGWRDAEKNREFLDEIFLYE